MSYRLMYLMSLMMFVMAVVMVGLLGVSLYNELWAAARVGGAGAVTSLALAYGFLSIGRRLRAVYHEAAQRVLPSKLQLHLDEGELSEDEYRRVIALLEAARETE